MEEDIKVNTIASKNDDHWWQNTVIYQVYLPAFKDSNNDGIGDFQGLTSMIDYFGYLKVDTILLSPFYPSPMKDNGYDITNFIEVDPQYGTMQDFDNFMAVAKERGLNILLDIVANHSSDRHEWFLKSIQSEEPFKDYYVWADPKSVVGNEDQPLPPSNWLSVFGGSAWKWNETRKQFYLHQFLFEQPDLNLRNLNVRKELQDVLKFWLEKGADGFRIDAISHFFEDEQLRDEPELRHGTAQPGEYDYLDHIYTKGHPENLDIISEWRDLLNEYWEKTGKYKLLLTEVVECIPDTMRYYGSSEKILSDIPFNFELVRLSSPFTAMDLLDAIKLWTNAMPEGRRANWILGNHDNPRFASRIGPSLVNGLHMIILLLPGIPFCYYGDEIGMENAVIPDDKIRDSFALRTKPENSRDPSRTPMQWNNTTHAGFTENAEPWLPVHENYVEVNIQYQQSNHGSVLQIYRSLIDLRKEPAVQKGITEYPFVDGNVFSLIRVFDSQGFLVVVNFGKCSCIVDFTETSEFLPGEAYVKISNVNLEGKASFSGSKVVTGVEHYASTIELSAQRRGSLTRIARRHSSATKTKQKDHKWKIMLNDVFLLPRQAMVLSFVPSVKMMS